MRQKTARTTNFRREGIFLAYLPYCLLRLKRLKFFEYFRDMLTRMRCECMHRHASVHLCMCMCTTTMLGDACLHTRMLTYKHTRCKHKVLQMHVFFQFITSHLDCSCVLYLAAISGAERKKNEREIWKTTFLGSAAPCQILNICGHKNLPLLYCGDCILHTDIHISNCNSHTLPSIAIRFQSTRISLQMSYFYL